MNMKKNSIISAAVFSLLAVMLFATGCKKQEETKVPMVTILDNSEAIGSNTAVLYAEVTDNGGAVITERGFCYGKTGSAFDTVLCDEGADLFSVELSNLTPMTSYTCKAFAGNEAGRGYSSELRFTTEIDTVPRVKTWYVQEVTHCSAVASGQVLGSGGQTVEECGICYGTESLPTVDDMRIMAGSGEGPFDCQLTDLLSETKYYVRAYVVCTKGVYYGGQVEFETDVLPMEVRTVGVSEVTATRAKAEGEVIRDGGSEVKECGFCWGTEHQPTIDGLHIKAGIGVGAFSSYFSGLERGRTHYLRAYAVNMKGVSYGEEVEFVPDDSSVPWPGGTLPGLFSVSPDRQVRFSQGNLQYFPDDNMWRFAERQWDFVGGKIEDPQLGMMDVGTVFANGVKCDNTMTWKYYEGWIDLFGWGTSGWNNGNEYYRPFDYASYAFNGSSYGPRGNFDLTGDYAEADWGIHNTISNGGSRRWRTPTVDEISYLLTERETPSGMLFASAFVGDVRGLILLPDNWEASVYPLNAVNEYCSYNSNMIAAREWLEVLEPAGAVFLPAGGVRFQYTGYEGIYFEWNNNEDFYFLSGPPMFSPNQIGGSYWTTTQSGMSIANALVIFSYESMGSFVINTEARRCNGRSVRLISDE